MAITDTDWQKIYRAIEKAIPPSAVVQGKVVRADAQRNLIWLKEFGDQPIPLFAFDFDVTYYDTQFSGVTPAAGQPIPSQLVKKKAKTKIVCPKVGDIVLVIKQHGSRRLPKCVGVLRSTGFAAGSSD
jgi:hypothetical protein